MAEACSFPTSSSPETSPAAYSRPRWWQPNIMWGLLSGNSIDLPIVRGGRNSSGLLFTATRGTAGRASWTGVPKHHSQIAFRLARDPTGVLASQNLATPSLAWREADMAGYSFPCAARHLRRYANTPVGPECSVFRNTYLGKSRAAPLKRKRTPHRTGFRLVVECSGNQPQGSSVVKMREPNIDAIRP